MKAFLLAGLMVIAGASGVAAQGKYGAMTADAPTLAQMRTVCAIGSAPQPAGTKAADFKWGDLTPTKVAGATTVSAREAKCVIDRFPGAILIADAASDSSIGDALGVNWVGGPTATEQQTTTLRRMLSTISGGRTDMPIVVYCHHTRCAYSYYAAQRMVSAGYTSVLWMRGGTEEWKAEGYPMESRPNRWSGAMTTATKALTACFERQALPQDVKDAKAATEAMMRGCGAEERGLRTSLEEYDRTTGANSSAATLAYLQKAYENVSRVKIESATKLAEHNENIAREEKERAERHAQFIYLQGANGQPTMEVYQYCQATGSQRIERKLKYTQYYSEIFLHRISKQNEGNIASFNKLSYEFESDHSKSFLEYVKRIAPGDRLDARCISSPTKEHAKALWDMHHKSAMTLEDKKVDLPWTPGAR